MILVKSCQSELRRRGIHPDGRELVILVSGPGPHTFAPVETNKFCNIFISKYMIVLKL